MSISPESFASDSQRYGWKINMAGLDAGETFAKLYNLARPENVAELTVAEGKHTVVSAIDKGDKTIGTFRGVHMAFAPDGNTTGDAKAWDLFSYLKANDSVGYSALKGTFGDALQPMPLPEKGWRDQVLAGIRAKQEAESAAGAAR